MNWIMVVIEIAIAVVAFIGGYKVRKSREKNIGGFVVDHVNPEVNGGVYTIFDVDPMSLKDGETVVMDVMVADVNLPASQEEQG